jgi:hypothetical protein
MKRITFLFLNFMTVVAFAQSYTFNESLDDWTAAGSCDLATGITEMSVNLTVAGSNPSFGITTASIDGTTNKIGAVTLKNSNASGPTYIRISYPKAAGGRIYFNLEMTAGDTEFKTYYFDLTNAEWDGTETDVKVHFKASGNTTYAIPAGVSILVDKIEFLAEIPTSERHSFEFNTEDDAESWSAVNANVVSVTAGKLTFAPTADKFAKLQLDGGLYHVNTSTVNELQITLQNLSTNDDELRVIIGGGGNTSIDLSVSDASDKVYSIDLSGVTGWTGDLSSIQLGFRDKDNAAGVGKSSGTGNILINSIVFNNTLATEKINKESSAIQIFPNPANNMISVSAPVKILQITLYDLAGKIVLVKSHSNSIDVSSLSSGIYIAKIYNEDGIISTSKFVKN